MIEQWSKVAGAALVAIFLLLILGVLSVILGVVATVSCFVGAVFLVRSALEDFSQWEPVKLGISEEELDAAKMEIELAVDQDFRSAENALEKTLIEWENIVDRRVGINIFDGVNDIDRWPLDKWEVRRFTGLAVEEYLEVIANPPTTNLAKAQRASRLDENNFRLRTVVREHVDGKRL